VNINPDEVTKPVRELGTVIVQVFLNKAGLGAALVKVNFSGTSVHHS